MANVNDESGWGAIFCGGAMGTSFSAGVAWSLWRHGFPGTFFKRIVGVSGGAATAAYFLTNQLVEGRRIWLDIIPKGMVRYGWPILNLGFLTTEVFQQRVPLDVETLTLTPTKFSIVATDCMTGLPVFLNGRGRSVFGAIKASCALWPYHGAVVHGGNVYIDGGFTAPIPLWNMIGHGVKNILVILPHPIDEKAWDIPLPLKILARRLLPEAGATAYEISPHRYEDALRTLRRPPEWIRVVVVAPKHPTPARRLERDRGRIEKAMHTGDDVMSELIATGQFP